MGARLPSLRAVAAFEAAARHASFSKAATELNLTQGAVSHAIQGLETRLGVKLFDRGARRLVLTEAGRILAGKVRLSLGLLSGAFESRPWLEKDRLSIAALPVLARRIIGPKIVELQSAFPTIEFHISASKRLDDIERIHDLGLRYGPGGWSGLSAVKLADEVLIAVASPKYAHGSISGPQDLLRCDLIGQPDFPWAPWLNAAGVDVTDEPRAKLVTDDSDLLIDVVTEGAGVALVRSALVRNELKEGALVRLIDFEHPSAYSYWLAWNPTSQKLDLIDSFRQWLAKQLA